MTTLAYACAVLLTCVYMGLVDESWATDGEMDDDRGRHRNVSLSDDLATKEETPPSDVALGETPRSERILVGEQRLPPQKGVELRTSFGLILGTIEVSNSPARPDVPGRHYFAFRGIPYVKPPVGPLRWADPEPVEPVKEQHIDATRFRPFCPQFDHDKHAVVGSEDCLYLNVYTPALPDRGRPKLPVLVFIHGGAYTRGASSSHGPQFLMREDIVLVTFNYRLGILGFLSTDDYVLAGNYGALDQVATLKWVSKYIEDFGGDPNSVTLGGFSAGAAFVHLHLLSPLSKGLFHKAIIMSGAGNCLWSIQPEPWRATRELARYLNCPLSSSVDIKQCLLFQDTETLIKAQAKHHRYVYWPFHFRPVVDRGFRDQPFLPTTVKELLTLPQTTAVPILIGSTPEEGLLFALTVFLFSEKTGNPSEIYEEASLYIFSSLWPNITTAEGVANMLRSFYYSPAAKEDASMLVEEMTEAMTDMYFTSCIWDAASSLAVKAPVFTYLMTHHESSSPTFAAPLYRLATSAGIQSPLLSRGVSHGDDIILLFSFPNTLGAFSLNDHRMSVLLTSLWGNFIRTGSPQGAPVLGFPNLPPWIPVPSNGPIFYYRLSLPPGMVHRPFKYKERNLWQQMLPRLEETNYDAERSVGYQAATWTLLTVCLLLLLVALLIGLMIQKARKSKTYHSEGATLRSSLPRPSSSMGSGVY